MVAGSEVNPDIFLLYKLVSVSSMRSFVYKIYIKCNLVFKLKYLQSNIFGERFLIIFHI